MTMEAPPYKSLSKWIDDHPPSGQNGSVFKITKCRGCLIISWKLLDVLRANQLKKARSNSGPIAATLLWWSQRGSAPVREGKSALREAGPILTPTHSLDQPEMAGFPTAFWMARCHLPLPCPVGQTSGPGSASKGRKKKGWLELQTSETPQDMTWLTPRCCGESLWNIGIQVSKGFVPKKCAEGVWQFDHKKQAAETTPSSGAEAYIPHWTMSGLNYRI